MHKYKRVTAMVTALLMLWLLICSPVQFTAQASESTVVFYSYDEAVEYVRDMLVAREENIVFGLAPGVDGNIMDIIDYAMTYYPGCTGSTGDALNAVIGSYGGCLKYYSTVTVAEYTVEYYTTAEQEAELTKAVNEALASLGLEGKSTYEKVKLIHDYICDRVDYDYEHYFSNEDYKLQYTAYAAMCNRTAVCQGYAALFYRMCMDAGIPTRMMRGSADGGPHAWNIVKIGDYYYNVDATWDGQSNITKHDYFLKGDTWFSMSHIKTGIYVSDEFRSEFPISSDAYVDNNSQLKPDDNGGDSNAGGGSSENNNTGENNTGGNNTEDNNTGGNNTEDNNTEEVSYIVDGVDYSAVFNADYYYSNHKDVANAFGKDAQALFNHFINHGINEGRQASEAFNVESYKANNPDLVNVFGNDTRTYYIHYIKYGKAEGRKSTGSTESGGQGNTQDNTQNETQNTGYVVDGVDYSAVFNADYYYSHHRDVANAFGKDAQTLFNHFVSYGINEGRQASEAFDVEAYKANNPDLVNVFGGDTRTYYIHYIKYGKAEGRKATGSTQNNGYVVDGVDYSAVFNADYYYNHHKDVANAIGNNARALFNHFMTYGIYEGRQACEEFNLDVYKANNGDLVSAFGNDTRTYYIHFIKYGKSEGRISH